MKRAALIVAACIFSFAPVQKAIACIGIQAFSDDLAFGFYNPLSGAPVASTFNIRIECVSQIDILTFPFAFQIGIDSLINSGTAIRTMQHSSLPYSIAYEIYTDSGLSSVWGRSGTGVGSEVIGQFLSIGASQPRNFTGYAQIPGGQNIPSGLYSDNMIVTVIF